MILVETSVAVLLFYYRRGVDEGEAWSCRQCKQGYDMEAIEQRLVVALNQHVRAYELQV